MGSWLGAQVTSAADRFAKLANLEGYGIITKACRTPVCLKVASKVTAPAQPSRGNRDIALPGHQQASAGLKVLQAAQAADRQVRGSPCFVTVRLRSALLFE